MATGGGEEGTEVEALVFDGGNPVFSVTAPGRRIFALGDLHGDLEKTEMALTTAGLLSSDGKSNWTGGSSVLVQVGDVLDRGDREIAILSLLKKLQEQAKVEGGAVLMINGNHETMNVTLDFRNTSPGAMTECESFLAHCLRRHEGDFQAGLRDWYQVKPKPARSRKSKRGAWKVWLAARKFLFEPGGPLAKELAKNGVVLKVNNWLFVHGGLLPQHVDYGLHRMNQEVSDWMRAGCKADGRQAPNPHHITRNDGSSVLWTRLYSKETFEVSERESACANLNAVLKATGCRGMVVGHTPQRQGANSECDGLVWRIDAGMSNGMAPARPEILEIMGDHVAVRRPEASCDKITSCIINPSSSQSAMEDTTALCKDTT